MKDQQKNERIESRSVDLPNKTDATVRYPSSVRYPSPALNRSAERAHASSHALKESVPGRLLSGVVGVAEVFLRGSARNAQAEAVKHPQFDETETITEDPLSASSNKETKGCGASSAPDPDSTTAVSNQVVTASLRLQESVDYSIAVPESKRTLSDTSIRNKYHGGSAWNLKNPDLPEDTPSNSDPPEMGALTDQYEYFSPKQEGLQPLIIHKNQRLGGMVGSAVTISSGVVEGIRNSVPSLPSASMFTWAAGKSSAEDVQRLEEQNMALAAEVSRAAMPPPTPPTRSSQRPS